MDQKSTLRIIFRICSNFFKKEFAKKKKLLSLQPLNKGYKKRVHRKIENILKINVEQNIQAMFS